MRLKFLLLFLPVILLGYSQSVKHDLVILNASVFNADGSVSKGRTIVIDNGIITEVSVSKVDGATVIDAGGKLVTPGFMDVVAHTDDIFGDSVQAMKNIPDSFEVYRRRFSSVYIPYGVTTVRTSGDCEEWLPVMLYWMKNPRSDSPDVIASGGSIVQWYEGRPYINHVLVKDSAEAAAKVEDYYNKGIRHVKLYCTGSMTYPVFSAGFSKARDLKMVVSSQVQRGISIDSVLSLGFRNFEHASTLVYESTVLDFRCRHRFQRAA
jgi:hypothetical protein